MLRHDHFQVNWFSSPRGTVVPLDPALKTVLDQMAEAGGPTMREAGVDQARQMMQMLSMMDGDVVELVRVEDLTVAHSIPARLYADGGAGGRPILVWYHGGGFVIGDLETADRTCRKLAKGTGAVVVSVDYRLAPEHPYPAPLDDCWTAVQWTATHAEELGGDAARIAVGGDSAGGNLAAVCALLARDAGGPALSLQALVYPVCDVDFETASYVANGEGYLLDLDQMQWFVDCYTTGHVDPTDWHVSPLRAPDLGGVAPAVIITAEYDPLRDEGAAYADRLREAGVAVEYRCFEGMIHSFFGLQAFDAARDAMDFVATELRRAFGTLDL